MHHISDSPEQIVPATVTLTNLSTLSASPVANTTSASNSSNHYNSMPVKVGGGNQVHNVISVDAGTSARGQEKAYSGKKGQKGDRI